MKIHYLSDIHLDISGPLKLPGGEVLILAGDACEAHSLQKEFHSTKPIPYHGGAYPCYDFFHFECSKYDKVFYVLGNHEHYGGKMWKTKAQIETMLPSNVTVLEDQSEIYQGIKFIGSTLWTDMDKGNPVTLNLIQGCMNDYRKITYKAGPDSYRKLRPIDTVHIHRESRKFIENELKQGIPTVVITHMAPTGFSINEKFAGAATNAAYFSDLSELILDNPNIKYWIHGHVHDPADYMVGETRVLCNPRGYLPWEADNGFQEDMHEIYVDEI